MTEIERGTRLLTRSADGVERQLRALTGIVPGGDFAVVWACSEREWENAADEGRDPSGIPWPADDVRVDNAVVA